ncbi:MAG TPA: hypothetical protein VL094_05535 [Sphingomonadaceae bacterium]|nr:hypothetical protein [Sphingomonadaceae bacterium]
MKSRFDRLEQIISVLGLLALGSGLLVGRFSGNLIAAGFVPFLVVATGAVVLRGFFASCARQRYTESPGYRIVVAQHYEKYRLAFLILPATAIILAWYSLAENVIYAAVVAGILTGLPFLGLTMKSAFAVKAKKNP